MYYKLDKNKRPVPTDDREQASKDKIIAQTIINGSFVSTVFLYDDELLVDSNRFETAVFMMGKNDKPCYGVLISRSGYNTYEEAVKGHKHVCQRVEHNTSFVKNKRHIEVYPKGEVCD